MAFGYHNAREGSRYAATLIRDGLADSNIRQALRIEYPDANFQERRRMVFRAHSIVDLEDFIIGGGDPGAITLPYPLPPSSLGTSPPADAISIDFRSKLTTADNPDRYRIARIDDFSGTTWIDYLSELDAMFDEWEEDYGADSVLAVPGAITIF